METKYILTAELKDEVAKTSFYADDYKQAMFTAINLIMDLSFEDKNNPWSLGSVTLSDSNGNVINQMAAK